jgi:wobble nucleotide-excising tRNase
VDDLERIHDIETKLSLVERDGQVRTQILDKLENTVETLRDLLEAMHIIITKYDGRMEALEKSSGNIEDRVSDLLINFKVDVLNQLALDAANRQTERVERELKHVEEQKRKEKKSLWEQIKPWWQKGKFLLIGASLALGFVAHKWNLFGFVWNYIMGS